jgi:hypothetical protein
VLTLFQYIGNLLTSSEFIKRTAAFEQNFRHNPTFFSLVLLVFGFAVGFIVSHYIDPWQQKFKLSQQASLHITMAITDAHKQKTKILNEELASLETAAASKEYISERDSYEVSLARIRKDIEEENRSFHNFLDSLNKVN